MSAEPERPQLELVHGGATGGSFEERVSAPQLGLWILLASLGVLFAATIVGYLIIRYRTEGWASGLPALPSGLFLSTALLLALSVVLELSVRAARAGAARGLRRWLWTALGLAVVFLVGQGLNWLHMVNAAMPPDTANLYAFTFYLLTGTHAAHVVGGLFPLGFALRNARLGRYGPGSHEGLRLVAQYWHFLDIVWLVLLAVIWGTS